MAMLSIGEQLASDKRCRKSLPRFHGTGMCIDPVLIVRALTVDLGRFGEEVLIQADLVHQDLLAERVNIVDKAGGAATGRQRLTEFFVVLEVELYTQFGRPVLDAYFAGHNDLRVVQLLDEAIPDLVTLRFQLGLSGVELTTELAACVVHEISLGGCND